MRAEVSEGGTGVEVKGRSVWKKKKDVNISVNVYNSSIWAENKITARDNV